MTIFGMYLTSWLFQVVTINYLIGAAAAALAIFLPFGMGVKGRLILCIIAALCFGGGTAYWIAFHQGEEFAVQKMAAREAGITRRVHEKTQEVDQCNGGADWDVVTGTCGGPSR